MRLVVDTAMRHSHSASPGMAVDEATDNISAVWSESWPQSKKEDEDNADV